MSRIRADRYTNRLGTGAPVFSNGVNITGNVGVGTTVPTSKLTVVGNINVTGGSVGIGTDNPLRQLDIFSTTHATAALKGDTQSSLFFVDSADSNIGQISYIHADNYMYFRVNDAERLRIASDGKITTGAVNVSYGGTIGIGKSFYINHYGGIFSGVRYENHAGSSGDYTQGFNVYSHNGATLESRRYSPDDGGVFINLKKSRDATGDGLVNAGDTIASIFFQPNNGAGFTNGASIEGAVDDNTGDTISLSVIPTKFKFNLRDSAANSDRIYFTANNDFNWGEVGQGHTQGTIHLLPKISTAHSGGAITWGAEDDGFSNPYNGGERAHAGIYVRSDGTYGTKMYLSTTDSYAAGSKTAIKIDQYGAVHTRLQPFIYGVPTNTGGSGIFNSLGAIQARGGMTFTTDRITVSQEGVYLISFNTICDTTVGRIDTFILVNGSNIVNTLNEANGNGYHYRGASICRYLYANDYIQVNNGDWYSAASNTTTWKTMSVAFLG
tara:strand:+ start:25 stop:1512 length:1488 start_codon:yes stop_codon:yes gene_type:complete